jgi:hypothetical protein
MTLEIGTTDFESYCEKRAEIERLETLQTLRLMREAILGNADAITELQNIENQISTLRTEMSTLENN